MRNRTLGSSRPHPTCIREFLNAIAITQNGSLAKPLTGFALPGAKENILDGAAASPSVSGEVVLGASDRDFEVEDLVVAQHFDPHVVAGAMIAQSVVESASLVDVGAIDGD